MIKDIKELNFPAYATLETASATIADMGDRTITSQVKIDGDVVPDFSYDWEVEFKGERHIHPVKTPQGTKDNSSLRAKIDLVFQHWAIYEMKRQYFVEMASISAGTAIADKYIASLGLNLEDFVTAFNLVLNHYFGGRIIIKLNPNPLQPYSKEAKFVSISYSYIWDVLQQTHEIYGVRWTLKTNADGVCEILMGYPAEEVSHIFEYGFEGGLLSVQRQVQSTEIRNRLLGRGGNKNLPYRYFKDKDPNNPLFEADPDWIPELANIAFTELRGKTFRDYVKGWKAKRYGGTPMAVPTEAYLAGYNAEKFDPIEYVDDKESIEKYGVHVGALENNEEIYPSIQGAPGDVDMIVDAEQVIDDNIESAVTSESVVSNISGSGTTITNVANGEEVSINISERSGSVRFSVPSGGVGTILQPSFSLSGKKGNPRAGYQDVSAGLLNIVSKEFTIHKQGTNEEVSINNIPAGDYYYKASVVAKNNSGTVCNITVTVTEIKLNVVSTGSVTKGGWKNTFDIWVRNIWGSSRKAGETDRQYADRVWLPILGDRMGDEARVVFASGWLSFSSDWEFPIVGYAYDDSKEGSHWRLTLAKSEAELEASGKYIPYEGYNASAGDRFFFIGIDMPWQYVYWGEERIDDYKRDTLPETARINPSWVIKADKVRLNQDRDGAVLVDSLNAGSQIRLASKQFISGAYESLYVQSMTYNWTSDTILYPDVEVVVSDKVHTVKNPVAQIQGSIETIQRQVGSLSNIQQIIRQVCDTLYLRKDGIKEISLSPTEFRGLVSGQGFRQGNIGGAGWGFYRDANGRSVAEVDKLVVRNDIEVNNLVVNEVTHIGGEIVYSMANMICSAVEETENGYRCFFDQKQGTIVNLFAINDIVWCQKFEPDNTSTKYYKRIVTEVSETYIVLSKSPVDGNDIPSINDNIIHFGNTTNKDRQSAIIINPRNGGSITIFAGIDSFDITDRNYVSMGVNPTTNKAFLYGYGDMFFGDRRLKSNFITFQNGKMVINADVTFGADSTGLSNLGEWQDLESNVNTAIEGVQKSIQEVQDQIDGVVENYFMEGVPLTSKAPVTDWKTDNEKINHIGDTYTNISEYQDKEGNIVDVNAGKSWRWCQCGDVQPTSFSQTIPSRDWYKVGTLPGAKAYKEIQVYAGTVLQSTNDFAYDTDIQVMSGPPTYIRIESTTYDVYVLDRYGYFNGNTFSVSFIEDYVQVTDKDGNSINLHWHPIADSDATKALLEASKAQDTADSKRRTFVNTPTTPYDEGDLWAQGESGDIYRCIVSRSSGSYNSDDWQKASKYTDDTTAKQAIRDAAAAQSAADNAAQDAQAANAELQAWTADGVISPVEKQALKNELAQIEAEYQDIQADCQKYGLTASYFPDFKSDYEKYRETLLNKIETPGTATIGTLAGDQSNYYKERTTILEAIAAAAKKIADDAMQSASEASRPNLLANSAELVIAATGSNTYKALGLPITISTGDEFTFKAENIESLAGTANLVAVRILSPDLQTAYASNTVGLGENKVLTFKITTEGVSNAKAVFLLYAGTVNSTTGNTIRYTNFSLVKGTTAMATWEDYQGDSGLKNLINIRTEKVMTIGSSTSTNNYYNVKAAELYVSPNETYTFKVEKSRILNGSDTGFNVGIYNQATEQWLSKGVFFVKFGESTYTTMTIKADVASDTKGALLIYSGQQQTTAGKQIEITRASLVRGSRPMMVWKENTDYLTNAFKNGSTKISGGLTMTQAVMVEDESGTVRGMLNGSTYAEDATHGRLIVAAGSAGSTESQLSKATTRIYEDGHIESKSANIKGSIESNSAIFKDYIVYKYTDIQTACNNGTISSSYTLPSTAPTYILFNAASHSGLSPILKFPSTYEDGRTITIATTPKISRMDGQLTLSGTFYLVANSEDGAITPSATSITLTGGKVELLRANNMWLVLTKL